MRSLLSAIVFVAFVASIQAPAYADQACVANQFEGNAYAIGHVTKVTSSVAEDFPFFSPGTKELKLTIDFEGHTVSYTSYVPRDEGDLVKEGNCVALMKIEFRYDDQTKTWQPSLWDGMTLSVQVISDKYTEEARGLGLYAQEDPATGKLEYMLPF